jgi:hypothetical protein
MGRFVRITAEAATEWRREIETFPCGASTEWTPEAQCAPPGRPRARSMMRPPKMKPGGVEAGLRAAFGKAKNGH